MVHTVPTFGYVIFSHRKKLKPEYIGLPGIELKELRKTVSITEDTFVPEIAFTRDTTIEGILREPIFLQARVLIMECTFLDDEVSPETAREYGHVHVTDIIEHSDKFANECIILTHFSARYSRTRVENLIEVAKLPASLRSKVHLL
jgi:ribonuclease Z